MQENSWERCIFIHFLDLCQEEGGGGGGLTEEGGGWMGFRCAKVIRGVSRKEAEGGLREEGGSLRESN